MVNNQEKKISQFADDTTCILKTEESVNELVNLTKYFQSISGLKLNREKSEIMWLGTWQKNRYSPVGLKLQPNCIKVLGIGLGHDKAETKAINFAKKIEKLETRLNIWRQRDLTIIGRILVTKAHGISNLIYSMSTQYTTESMLQEAHKSINRFIWNNKPPKVKHTTLIAPENEGGLKAPDIFLFNKAIKLTWLSRLVVKQTWNPVIALQMQEFGGWKLILHSNITIKSLTVPVFYKQILQFFHEIFEVPYKNQIVWNNKLIKIASKTIFWKDWYDAGIICFLDVMDENCRFITFENFIKKFKVQCQRVKYNKFKKAVQRGAVQYKKSCTDQFVQITLNQIQKTVFKTKVDNFLDITKAKSKDYYNEFISAKIKKPTRFEHWKNEYEIDERVLYQSYPNFKRSCRDTKLLTFQYKILNDLVATNKNLEKWGVKNSELCESCSQEDQEDTLWHSLCECPSSVNIMTEITTLLNLQQFDAKSFIFGTNDKALNLLLLIAKHMIWRSRFFTRQFKISEYIAEAKLHITADANKMSDAKFVNKWENFIFIMEL